MLYRTSSSPHSLQVSHFSLQAQQFETHAVSNPKSGEVDTA